MTDKIFNKISFFDLALTLSNAVDLISPDLYNHQKQVAYIASCIGKELNLPSINTNNLIIAGLLHDVGGLTLKDRLEALAFEAQNPYRHAEIGYLLLRNLEEFQEVAKIIKYHHLPWENGKGKEFQGETVPMESHIIHLGDRIAVSIKKNPGIITQAKTISALVEDKYHNMFHPEILEAFRRLKIKESFWLDIISSNIENKLRCMGKEDSWILDLEKLLEVTQVFAHIIDFRSRFTSVHSSGVAIVAEALAKTLHWTEEESTKLKIAGYLHDIGKLAIPKEILEKPDKLTEEEFNIMKTHTYYSYHLLNNVEGLKEINEYASFHHERINGQGYPFHITGQALSEGARIMGVADVFTAITENRPYRRGMTSKRAIEVLEKMGKEEVLDANIVSILKEHYYQINEKRLLAQQEAFYQYQNFTSEIAKVRSQYYE
ncbi:HD-GYP domain-containing protein [Natronincola ferrireducens]|uniref:HDIG domain-containing protein n=1 Tax=Natronincola ferrireducens TaxID=393762 RepID=A0A1G9EGS7_9FIRM|nr:HD domain-containing phosphohydrolase [Natronincola ferrireducens]SDK75288.1 HDIG domain-containing protein [Natronincola ferrireducens]